MLYEAPSGALLFMGSCRSASQARSRR